nr:MAG TPA: tail fiber protein [Caudoviricetes sp.]
MKLYNLASAGFFIAKNLGGKMALSLLAANNAQTVLAAGISSTATSLTVNTGTGTLFPSPVTGTSFFKLTIIDAATGSLTEIVHVTARNGDVFTIQRGQEGTVARAWSANDIAANMMTAGTLSYILGNFQPLDPTLTALAALVGVANKLPYFNGNDTAALTDLTQVGRDIIGKSTIADILTYLGLVDASGIVGRLVNIQVITSTQQYVPTTGARRIISILTGGGAGGAPANAATTSQIYSGGGGGAGGTAIGIFTLSAISNFLVTVGSGGASNNAGGNSTAFGMTARGGLPGTNNVGTSSSAGGFGSDSSGGLINISGGDGGDGQAATRLVGGTGGSSFWGGSGRSGSGNGAPGKAPGSGGGGARDDQLSGTAYTGGAGADGICLILEFA